MPEPTDVYDTYEDAYDMAESTEVGHLAGLYAVDRAAVRRTLDEIEAFLSHGFPPDGFVSVTEMQGRLRLMRGGQ